MVPRTAVGIAVIGVMHWTPSGTVFQPSEMLIWPIVPCEADTLKVQELCADEQLPWLNVAPERAFDVSGPAVFVAVTDQLQVLPVWLPMVRISGFKPKDSDEQEYGNFVAQYSHDVCTLESARSLQRWLKLFAKSNRLYASL